MNEDFLLNVDLYKRGLFEYICFRDIVTNEPFAYHKAQIEALQLLNDNVTSQVGYGGAARGGKSALIATDAIFACHAFPKSVHVIGRKNLTNLWLTTWKTLLRMLYNFGFEQGVHYKYNDNKHELTFSNGSVILAKNLEHKPSDKEGTEYGSLEIMRAYIDQSEHVPLKIVEKVTERAGSHYTTMEYNQIGKTFEAFNPAPSHTKTRYWKPYKAKKEKQSRKFVRALPTDNPSREAKEWVKQKEKDYKDGIMSEAEHQKQIKGNFDYDDNDMALMDRDSITSLFSNDHVELGAKRYITIDAARNGSDKAVIIVWKGLYAVEIKSFDKSKTTLIEKTVESLRRIYGVSRKRVICDDDGVGGGIVDHLKCVGFVNNSKPLNNENYKNLKTQCYYKLSEYVNASKIAISSRIYNTEEECIITELEAIERVDPDDDNKLQINKKSDVKDKIGRSPDYADALMMRMWFDISEIKRIRISR